MLTIFKRKTKPAPEKHSAQDTIISLQEQLIKTLQKRLDDSLQEQAELRADAQRFRTMIGCYDGTTKGMFGNDGGLFVTGQTLLNSDNPVYTAQMYGNQFAYYTADTPREAIDGFIKRFLNDRGYLSKEAIERIQN